MSELVTTGIEGLDLTLGGGLPDRTMFALIGEAGSHYDTFAQQILHNHVERGGKVAYYAVESTPGDIMDDMAVYGWELDKHMKSESWIFISAQTPDLQRLSELVGPSQEEVRVPLSQSLNTLKRDFLIRVKEGRWTAMQLSHVLLYYDFKDIIDLILYVKSVVRFHGGLHFFMLPHGVHADQIMNTLKHMVDGVLEFNFRERAREYEGILTVRKLRRVLHRTMVVPFMVTENGIIVERAERIV